MSTRDDHQPNLVFLFEKLKEESSDSSVVTPAQAASRISRCLQNIYTDMHLDNSDTRTDLVSRSFKLREYSELYLGRYVDNTIICGLYNYISNKDDWNKVVYPCNWGVICFQEDVRQTFMMFFSMALQNFIIANAKDLSVLQLQGKSHTELDTIPKNESDPLEQ